MSQQSERAQRFRDLHDRDHTFIMPNPWDVGTAKIFAQLGFAALATTSAGFASSVGTSDGNVDRTTMLQHCGVLAAVTDLPVSADLGNGFGDDPATVAETIRLAAAAGLVGGSIEDATGDPQSPIYERAQAVERVHAAVEAARALPFPFVLTARAENYLWNRRDLDDTLERLRAFEAVGADVLYAPGVQSEAEIRTLVASVARPVNVLAGISGFSLNLAQLTALHVRRISLGSSLSNAAAAHVREMGREMLERGTFSFVPG